MNFLHIYIFEYMYIENISINGHAIMCTNISTYGFSQLERKLKKILLGCLEMTLVGMFVS